MPKPPKDQTCGNCLFAIDVAAGKLECRRNPPAVSSSFSGLNLAAKDDRWPAVSSGAWCGEWKKQSA